MLDAVAPPTPGVDAGTWPEAIPPCRMGCPDRRGGAWPTVACQVVLAHLQPVGNGRRTHGPGDGRAHGRRDRGPRGGPEDALRDLRNVALTAALQVGVRNHGGVGPKPRREAAVGVTGQTRRSAGLRILHTVRDNWRGAGKRPSAVVHGKRPLWVRPYRHRLVVERPGLPAKDAGLEGDRRRGLGVNGQQDGFR